MEHQSCYTLFQVLSLIHIQQPKKNGPLIEHHGGWNLPSVLSGLWNSTFFVLNCTHSQTLMLKKCDRRYGHVHINPNEIHSMLFHFDDASVALYMATTLHYKSPYASVSHTASSVFFCEVLRNVNQFGQGFVFHKHSYVQTFVHVLLKIWRSHVITK
jgi:hypothetical protein